jgi:hypothetical protein
MRLLLHAYDKLGKILGMPKQTDGQIGIDCCLEARVSIDQADRDYPGQWDRPFAHRLDRQPDAPVIFSFYWNDMAIDADR